MNGRKMRIFTWDKKQKKTRAKTKNNVKKTFSFKVKNKM